MHRHKLLRARTLETLAAAPNGLSQLAIMCKCHGFRYAHQKLLYFSVQERFLKQARQFDNVNELLQDVLDEADAEYRNRAQKNQDDVEKRRRRERKLRSYDLKEPPTKVVTRPETHRLVSGNPHLKDYGLGNLGVAGMADLGMLSGSIVDGFRGNLLQGPAAAARWDQMTRVAGIIPAALLDPTPDFLKPPVYEKVPAQHGPSEYTLLDEQLRDKLRRYPKVVWQKIKIERRFADDDDETRRYVQSARQATRRVLQKLVNEGKIVVEQERSDAIYRLAPAA
jgi:hypothetical protein